MQKDKVTKKEIMHVYDSLKGERGVEAGRLEKALQLALQGIINEEYRTTRDHCYCPDSMVRRHLICKHRLAFMMLHPKETLVAIFLGELNSGPNEGKL
jgi:hypothetical protein